jgi:hypothetical protein
MLVIHVYMDYHGQGNDRFIALSSINQAAYFSVLQNIFQ